MKSYLPSIIKQFQYYKMLGEKTFDQLSEEQLFYQPNDESNNIAMIVKHMHGNMMSRWTNFLTDDGEKEWRQRDQEFDNDITSKEEMLVVWEAGWQCLFEAIKPLTENDLEQEIYIRNMGHAVVEAINRQLAHYSYHVGQLVYIGKICKNESWHSLSIPKGGSKSYNEEKIAKPKRRELFTDDL